MNYAALILCATQTVRQYATYLLWNTHEDTPEECSTLRDFYFVLQKIEANTGWRKSYLTLQATC
jgi:hypothetical protein